MPVILSIPVSGFTASRAPTTPGNTSGHMSSDNIGTPLDSWISLISLDDKLGCTYMIKMQDAHKER
jgi:precorrin-3B methylase